MTKEKRLQTEETIMEAVCELCHWPYVYRAVDEDAMYAEKCEHCPAAEAVKAELEKLADGSLES